MIRRRSTISIHDYPEHLNPFREERRNSIGNKFRSFGQRGTSFRNAWNLLLPHSKRSQSFSRDSSRSPERSNYDTWTVRRAPKSQHEAIGLPATWTIAPRRRYTPPNSIAGSPPRSLAGSPPPSPTRRGSQISLATLGTDVPSPNDRFHWQGARPKKRRAPLPPTSPTGSSATSSRAESITSLRDSQQPEDAKDNERETLQILVSRIQQEFGEVPKPSRHDQDDEARKEKDPNDFVKSTTHDSLRIEETSLQLDKAFVVEPSVSPTTVPDDTIVKDNSLARENTTAVKGVIHSEIDTDTNTKLEDDTSNKDDHSTNATEDNAINEKQITANVFVETTSTTISSDCRKPITACDGSKSCDTELENVTNIQEKPPIVANPSEKQVSSNTLDQTTCKNHLNDDKSETGSSAISEEVNIAACEISTSEHQIETVPEHSEYAAFVVSTPDTASVYEDAASEEDLEDSDVRTILNDRFKESVPEAHILNSNQKTDDINFKCFSNGAAMQTERDALHTKTSLTVVSHDVTLSKVTASANLTPEICATDIPSNISENTINSSDTNNVKTSKSDVSGNRLDIERTQSNSLKHHPSISASSNVSSFKVTLENGRGGMKATSVNESPLTPQKDNGTRANGDILRTPVTAPRNMSFNGLSEQTSSATKMETPIPSSSESTPTPPPRNKPQPVPRMKRLKKLFSNH